MQDKPEMKGYKLDPEMFFQLRMLELEARNIAKYSELAHQCEMLNRYTLYKITQSYEPIKSRLDKIKEWLKSREEENEL